MSPLRETLKKPMSPLRETHRQGMSWWLPFGAAFSFQGPSTLNLSPFTFALSLSTCTKYTFIRYIFSLIYIKIKMDSLHY